ncbi:MAG: sulfotransferase domain-containing protein [Candidatus Paceibacterota bacterium]
MAKEELHFFDKIDEKTVEEYLVNFEKAKKNQLVGEKTPTYSYDPMVPERMFAKLPDAKIIWILRNPIDRAYSNYWHAVKKGVEMDTFEDAVKDDDKRYKENIFRAYIRRSIYVEQIERYLEFYPLEQMYFITFEKLKNDPENEITKLVEFLKIPSFNFKEVPSSNKTYLPRSISLEYYSKKLFGKSIAWKLIHKLNASSTSGYVPMSQDIHERLVEYFKPYNEELSKYGIEIELWVEED